MFQQKMVLSLVLLIAVLNQPAAGSSTIYLSSFGYLDPSSTESSTLFVSGHIVRRAISEFQSFAGLNPTGILDEETSIWMSKPRCRVPDRDLLGEGHSTRRKRNADIQGDRWNKKHFTYRISKYTTDLEKSEVDQEIAKAFQVWAEVTELTFASLEMGKVDIEIRFESASYSGSDKPFDGPGGTLGYAFFPKSGNTHFDEAETWTINSTNGTNLFQVATHEFGHALGLNHSEVKTAVMRPFFDGYDPDFKLHTDDIERIQLLYGKNIAINSIKEKFQEVEAAFEKMENELKATKRELAEIKINTENIKTTLNARTRDIKDMDGKMPTSCEDLELMGQKISGIFLVKGLKKIDAVFCDFNPNNNNELQKWIGHADVKSEPVYFYVQRNNAFNATKAAIPFDVARVNTGNAMDLMTGIFTAPRSGTYFFAFTGLASFPETESPSWVYLGIGLYLNGNYIGRAQTEESDSVANQYSSLSLQSTLDLRTGDNVWLQIDDMSPSVVLHDDNTPGRDGHWTHFTGWMLEEEIAA